MEKKYDVILVGAGPAGIFCAYELITKNKNLKVLLVEKGNDIYSRKCPILEKKATKCPNTKTGTCYPSCAMTSGFGGCGAYSDGKFNITSEFGGWMGDYLDEDEVLDLIKYVDKIIDSLTFDNDEIKDFYSKITMVLNNYIDKRIGVVNA